VFQKICFGKNNPEVILKKGKTVSFENDGAVLGCSKKQSFSLTSINFQISKNTPLQYSGLRNLEAIF